MTDRSQGIAARCAALPGITILFYFTATPALFVWQQPTQYELGLLVLVGVSATLGQAFSLRAYRAGEATASTLYIALRDIRVGAPPLRTPASP
jgi:hypothetical protein